MSAPQDPNWRGGLEGLRLRCEAHVAEGLQEFARAELKQRVGRYLKLLPSARPETLAFEYYGDLQLLLALHSLLEVSLVLHFDVPRPRALLGDQHFRLLLSHIALVRRLLPEEAYMALHLNAAGAESAVLVRLREALAAETGLQPKPDEGDLLLRLRRPPGGQTGWEVLIRISPRPLATRSWRVCSMEGALNATVAYVMALLTNPRASDRFLNLACGSGTLLIERLSAASAERMIGCDTSQEALACAHTNLAASGYNEVELHAWDARELPLPEGSIDALCADLPFGHLLGSHQENLELYPAILREAARVARPGARFVVISQEVRLMERLLSEERLWNVERVMRVSLGGLYPRVFVLERR